MENIKAIETVYHGYRFRSRLEARWAVFFDALGIKYRYEPEGFSNEYGAYLPDFELLNKDGGAIHLYAEVKGDPFGLVNNFCAFEQVHDYGGVLPGFGGSLGSFAGLMLLGDIPSCDEDHVIFFPLIQHDEGLWRSWAMFVALFYPISVSSDNTFAAENINGDSRGVLIIHKEYSRSEIIQRDKLHHSVVIQHFSAVQNAFIAARSARFEHGENGATQWKP